MSRRRSLAFAFTVLALAGGVTVILRALRHGFSARDEPTRLEALLARAMRRYSVPADLRHRDNPVQLTPAVLGEARAHFADHCASCHGNDGKGQTALGRGLYPKAPDMTRDPTQSQSDGALFAVIENGIRLTGMPAWGDGTAESAYGSWTLVHFIRHLPKIGPEEIAEMEQLNPRSLAELETARREEEFLAGEDGTAPSGARPPSPPGHH
ncbi:MAG TPA: c-type cytochrome [Vicinamibacteria bacterium]|nr:c-type cytochrome [Vicinamibacteria bacterium]